MFLRLDQDIPISLLCRQSGQCFLSSCLFCDWPPPLNVLLSVWPIEDQRRFVWGSLITAQGQWPGLNPARYDSFSALEKEGPITGHNEALLKHNEMLCVCPYYWLISLSEPPHPDLHRDLESRICLSSTGNQMIYTNKLHPAYDWWYVSNRVFRN